MEPSYSDTVQEIPQTDYAYCNVHTLHVLFKTEIMPHLEYGCVVGDPHLLKDKTAIKNVYKFALRMCSKQ